MPLGRQGQGGQGERLASALGSFCQRHGQILWSPVLQQFPGDGREGAGSHEDGQSGLGLGEFGPVCAFLQQMMSFQDADFPGCASVGERDAGGGGSSLKRADPWDDFEGQSGGFQSKGLFAATAKEEGISSLQSHHTAARQGLLQHHVLDMGLGSAGLAPALAHRQGDGFWGKQSLKIFFQQGVVEDDLGLLQGFQPSQGQEIRRAGASSQEADKTGVGLEGGWHGRSRQKGEGWGGRPLGLMRIGSGRRSVKRKFCF